MIDRAQIVGEARTWIGTPYRHQASAFGAGTDCLGLLRGVWKALYGTEPEQPPAYSPDWSEPDGQERLWAAATRHLTPIFETDYAPGQVLLFRMRDGAVAKHLGLVSDVQRPAFIHAYFGRGVVESPLSEPWARRVVAKFDFPNIGD